MYNSRLLSHLISANSRVHAGLTRPSPRRNVRVLATTRWICIEGSHQKLETGTFGADTTVSIPLVI